MTALAAAAATKSPSAWAEPGTLGFLVVFGMAVILYFVFRSFSRHLRKVNEAARIEAEQAEQSRPDGVETSQLPADAAYGGAPNALANGDGAGRRIGKGFTSGG